MTMQRVQPPRELGIYFSYNILLSRGLGRQLVGRAYKDMWLMLPPQISESSMLRFMSGGIARRTDSLSAIGGQLAKSFALANIIFEDTLLGPPNLPDHQQLQTHSRIESGTYYSVYTEVPNIARTLDEGWNDMISDSFICFVTTGRSPLHLSSGEWMLLGDKIEAALVPIFDGESLLVVEYGRN